MIGRTPTSGRATLSAAKMEKPRSAWFSQGRGCTSRRYSGSIAVTSAPAATAARKITFGESRVAAA
jgi:hypothetical protein